MNKISTYAPVRAVLLVALIVGIVLTGGCSVRKYAINSASDALAGSGNSFAQDNDPELIRDAAPFSLKAMESMLAENPKHIGLLTATARGFTQYTYVFVQQDGEELEGKDIKAATVRFDRARLLYARARDYGLRGLEVTHPGIGTQLRQNPRAAVAQTNRDEVPLAVLDRGLMGIAHQPVQGRSKNGSGSTDYRSVDRPRFGTQRSLGRRRDPHFSDFL